MRFVYAILAHDAFDQLTRLIARLLSDAPDDRVCVHIDAKATPPAGFLDALAPSIRARVALIERPVAVHWAHWSQCAAMATLLDAALAAPFDMAHLLSGRDWPLCPREAMVADIAAARPGACFVDLRDDDMAWRMNDWCFIDKALKPRFDPTPLSWRIAVARSFASRQGDRIFKWLGRHRSEPLGPWALASQWWSLPQDAARQVRDAMRDLLDDGRLRFTQCSDEHVVPTALRHGGFGDRIVSAHRFFRFAPGEWSPVTLTGADLATRPADAWFGRKFDEAVDPTFLAL